MFGYATISTSGFKWSVKMKFKIIAYLDGEKMRPEIMEDCKDEQEAFEKFWQLYPSADIDEFEEVSDER